MDKEPIITNIEDNIFELRDSVLTLLKKFYRAIFLLLAMFVIAVIQGVIVIVLLLRN